MANPPVNLELDTLPESPVVWQPIALGVGQEPSAFADFQHTPDQGLDSRANYRRNPDGEWIIISRWPERP